MSAPACNLPPETCSLTLRWLGVAGIELAAGDRVLAIDPFFTRPPLSRLWLGRVAPDEALVQKHLPRCDAVIVTHAHWDHVMDVPAIVRHTGALALGSAQTCRLLTACGAPPDLVLETYPGQRLILGPFFIQVLAGDHAPVPGFAPGPLPQRLRPPLRLRDYRMDACFSLLVRVGGLAVLDWCHTRPAPAPRADVVLAGPDETPAYYAALLAATGARRLILLRWDDPFHSLSRPLRPFLRPPHLAWPPLQRLDPAALARRIEESAPGVRVLLPGPFQPYDLAALLA